MEIFVCVLKISREVSIQHRQERAFGGKELVRTSNSPAERAKSMKEWERNENGNGSGKLHSLRCSSLYSESSTHSKQLSQRLQTAVLLVERPYCGSKQSRRVLWR
nr:hypothetical protein L203_04271 [Cryptococcus depauperatus CBS 7841]ODN94500.1 hypothetical protein L204_04633 [Cryptococcus depauperatus CBS 7855]